MLYADIFLPWFLFGTGSERTSENSHKLHNYVSFWTAAISVPRILGADLLFSAENTCDEYGRKEGNLFCFPRPSHSRRGNVFRKRRYFRGDSVVEKRNDRHQLYNIVVKWRVSGGWNNFEIILSKNLLSLQLKYFHDISQSSHIDLYEDKANKSIPCIKICTRLLNSISVSEINIIY